MVGNSHSVWMGWKPLGSDGTSLLLLRRLIRRLLPAGVFHRVDELGISVAAADVAVHAGDDFLFRRVGIALQQRHGRDDVAGNAVAALVGPLGEEGFLHRM